MIAHITSGEHACINARADGPPDVGNSYCDMNPLIRRRKAYA